MCGRFTCLTREELADVADALAKAGSCARLHEGIVREQARPRSEVFALVPGGCRLHPMAFTWGFRPTASTDVVFNTRIESALGGTPLWELPLRDGRCILPVATFFEPHRTETAFNPRTGRSIKRQYEFADAQGKPLLLASVHDGASVSVLTTEPNDVVRPIHARMPLVLRFEEVRPWLEGDFSQLADRSAVQLVTTPERITPPGGPTQLSLF